MSLAIPFLCLDHMFCLFYRALDVKLTNAYQLMVSANIATSADESRHIEHHVQFGLAAPVMHKDVIELCSQKGRQYWVSEILKLYPNNYESPEIALHVLSQCCLKVITSAYLGAGGRFQLSEWRYTEHIVNSCCRSAMICLEGETAEQRLATLIVQVLNALGAMDNIARYALVFFSQFARGHFMDIKSIILEIEAIQNSSLITKTAINLAHKNGE